jgi:hypothetical protein
MARHDFYFALECSSQSAVSTLLEDLAEHVFEHVGCSTEHVEALSGALERASTPDGDGQGRCGVQFHAREGELEVLVSSNSGRVWQTSIILS